MNRNETIDRLIVATHIGRQYGPGNPFGEMTQDRLIAVQNQAHIIGDMLAGGIKVGFPRPYPAEAIPKATDFGPMLTAGELQTEEDVLRLALFGSALCDMYITDHTTDRGDPATPYAVRRFRGVKEELPAGMEHSKEFAQATGLLRHMQWAIGQYCQPKNAVAVLRCFDEYVLEREVEHFVLSTEYKALDSDSGRLAFMDKHAWRIGTLMARNAGVESVAMSNYAICAWHNKMLPTVGAVLRDGWVREFFGVLNVTARIIDELGDWYMDTGEDSDTGMFSINPFNQYHEAMVDELCRIGQINDRRVRKRLHEAFRSYRNDKNDVRAGVKEDVAALVMQLLYDHTQQYLNDPRQDGLRAAHPVMVNQAERVMKIVDVNAEGDRSLGGHV